MDNEKDAVNNAKSIQAIETWEEMEAATAAVNRLAMFDGKPAAKEFDRLTTLLATCTVAA